MGQVLYQRPRERLVESGAGALSTNELIQVLIGSGGRKASAARIAQKVSRLFETSIPSYANLVEISGVGKAKACQVLAAIELGRRVHTLASTPAKYKVEFANLKSAPARMLEYRTCNNAGTIITSRMAHIANSPQNKEAIRKMFAQALHDNASSIVVAVGYRFESLETLDASILPLLKTIFDTATLLEVSLATIWVVNGSSQKEFRRKALV